MTLILQDAGVDLEHVLDRLPAEASDVGRNDFVPALWRASLELRIDFPGMVAQSAHETGWWRFPGAVKAWFWNPAGLKVPNDLEVRRILSAELGIRVELLVDHPLVHHQWPDALAGAMGHGEHLLAYCSVPLFRPTYDPRYHLVYGKDLRLREWGQLGGNWAPHPDYGQRIEATRARLV